MPSFKRILPPILILSVGVAAIVILPGYKKPPKKVEEKESAPLIEVRPITLAPMQLAVSSHGVVSPQFETDLVAQIRGEMTYVSPAFVRGGFIEKGEVLARIDASDYEALLIEAKASLASAQAALQMEQAQAHVAKEEWKNITNSEPSELSLRKPQLAQEIARVKAAEAMVKRAQNDLERTVIKAPFDALVAERSQGLGAYVTPGAPLGKVLSVSPAEVRLPVSDKELQYLQNSGIDAEVLLKTNVRGANTVWRGVIERAEGVVDNKSRMTYLVAQIRDPYQRESTSDHPVLKYGTYVTAEIAGISLPSATRVPVHLLDDDERLPILTVDKTLTYKPVTVARYTDNDAILVDGIDDQDLLITSALSYPVEGMKLRLANPPEEEGEADEDKTASHDELAMKKDANNE